MSKIVDESPRDIWLQRIKLGEDSSLELKQVVWNGEHKIDGPHPDQLADELAAMANAAGGVLILGVDDKTKDIKGIPLKQLDALETWLTSICNDRINPPLDIQTQHIELEDSTGVLKPVIIVKVPKSLWVHQSPNGYLRRVGHAKRLLTPDMLQRLFQQRSQFRLIRFEEQLVTDATMTDLDPLLIRNFTRPGEGTAEEQLKRLHLIDEENGTHIPTIAGVLLCAYNPQQWMSNAEIIAVAHSGLTNNPNEQIDALEIKGTLDRQIWDALHFVKRNMQTPARKLLGRVDFPQYSLSAVFEAIVNAVAHRDYAIYGARIRLFMFSDRLEIYSPGMLPNTMSIDSMRTTSMPRNDVLCSLFSRYYPVHEAGLGRQFLMDRRGAGVDVILQESEQLSGKKPLYENLGDMELRLTIYAASLPD